MLHKLQNIRIFRNLLSPSPWSFVLIFSFDKGKEMTSQTPKNKTSEYFYDPPLFGLFSIIYV